MKNLITKYSKKFSNIRVLVVGDAMLDRYYTGDVERICREAPVPIVDIGKRLEMPGGAANAAVNLAALGAKTSFLGVIGDDQTGRSLRKHLEAFDIDTSGIVTDAEYQTMAKTRIMSKDQLILRFDTGSKQHFSSRIEQHILEKLATEYTNTDAILISDYGYGCVTETIKKFLKRILMTTKKICVIDAKFPEQYADFPATAIKPNYEEAMRLLNINTTTAAVSSRSQQIISNREELVTKLHCNLVAVTLDIEGAVVIEKNGSYHQTYAVSQPDSKAAGAGDTYVSALLLTLAVGAPMVDAAEIAGRAASVTVRKSATAFCTREELRNSYMRKTKLITSAKKMKDVLTILKRQQKRIVFTNGCFDLLHPGHVNYLNTAKSLGDILIIGINSDKSVKRIKGEARPINTLEDRLQVLMGLSSVDYVVPFDENTPISLIYTLKPDIYVKGGDYTKKTLPEASVVEKYGGIVKIIPLLFGKSTTNIINKIQRDRGGIHAII